MTTTTMSGLLLARLMGQYCFACCRLSASSVTRVGGRPPLGQAGGWSGGRQCTAGQYGYVPLGRHLVTITVTVLSTFIATMAHNIINTEKRGSQKQQHCSRCPSEPGLLTPATNPPCSQPATRPARLARPSCPTLTTEESIHARLLSWISSCRSHRHTDMLITILRSPTVSEVNITTMTPRPESIYDRLRVQTRLCDAGQH